MSLMTMMLRKKIDKGTEQDKRNFISGNYFLEREEAEEFIKNNRYKHRFWIADNGAKERMARIEKKIQQIKDEESFLSEVDEIIDEGGIIYKNETQKYDDDKPIGELEMLVRNF